MELLYSAIIIACIFGAAIGALILSERGDDVVHYLAAFIAIALGVAGGIGAIALIICSFSWPAAQTKADLINRQYGTNYTTREVFFAENIIDEIRQVQRQRMEATVNINTNK